jgi:hypothetical protein
MVLPTNSIGVFGPRPRSRPYGRLLRWEDGDNDAVGDVTPAPRHVSKSEGTMGAADYKKSLDPASITLIGCRRYTKLVYLYRNKLDS